VTDNSGGQGQDVALVTIVAPNNQPPTASAGGSQSVGVGQAVTLSGSGSHDPDGTIVAYDWDFGDGASHGSGAVVTHTYGAVGTYLVRLTVTDDKGATGSDVAAITVTGSANQAPVANAGGTYSGAPGQEITFDGSASHDPDGSIVSWAWDFGDGSSGTGVAPKHTYAAAGTFLVRLTVTDDKGATAEDPAIVTITAPGGTGGGGGCTAAGGPSAGGLGLALLALALVALRRRAAARR
jgi:MYXO-CTERM domain-containing protein